MESLRRLPAPNRDELIALGLLDPESPDAVDRERLLQFLMARGATLEELQRSRELADLVSISIDQALRPGPRMTRREASRNLGSSTRPARHGSQPPIRLGTLSVAPGCDSTAEAGPGSRTPRPTSGRNADARVTAARRLRTRLRTSTPAEAVTTGQ